MNATTKNTRKRWPIGYARCLAELQRRLDLREAGKTPAARLRRVRAANK